VKLVIVIYFSDSLILAYDRVIEIDSEFIDVWNDRGNALRDLGRYNESIEAYEKAIDKDPNYVYAWNGKGNSLCDLGRYNEATMKQ
jgi:tetratricopeptide (TPR) repeat protein